MNSIIVSLFVLMLGSMAHAQLTFNNAGLGAGALNQCNVQPAGGAISGADVVSNLNGAVDQLINQIQAKKRSLAEIDSQIEYSKSEMGAVLDANVIGAVAEHRQFNRNRNSYQDCKWDGHGAAVGSTDSNVNVPGNSPAANPGGRADGNSLRPLDEFCYQKAKINAWNNVAQDNGVVDPSLCDYRVGKWDGRPETSKSARCKKGLTNYYVAMKDRVALESAIADLDDKVHQIKLAINKVQDEVAEGSYCPYCHSGTTASSYGLAPGVLQNVTPVAGILNQPGANGVVVNGRVAVGGAGAVGGFPNGAYAAPVPGYLGVYNGQYGAVPGASGAGAFGCQGLGNNALNNSALANPQLAALLNPSQTNGLFASGVGPGFAPVVGNGSAAPTFLPLLAQANVPLPVALNQQQQQANLPYFARAMNPVAPYSAPYVGAYGNGAAFAGGPLISPNFAGAGNQYAFGSNVLAQQQIAAQYGAFQRSGNFGAGLPAVYQAPGAGGAYIPPGTGYRGTAANYAGPYGYGGGGTVYVPQPSYGYTGYGAGGGYPYAGALGGGLTIGGSIDFGALTIGGSFNTH